MAIRDPITGKFVKGGSQTVRLTGISGMKRALGRLITNSQKEIERALRMRAEGVMTKAKRDYVPVDQGPLRDSGWVGNVQRKGRGVWVELAFGGPAGSGNQGGDTNDEDVGYAVRQHEVEYQHEVGRDKFLEIPLLEAVATMPRDLANDIDLRRAAKS